MTFKRFNAPLLAPTNWKKDLILSLVLTTAGLNIAMAEVLQNGQTVYVGRTQAPTPYYSERQMIRKSSGYDARYQYADETYHGASDKQYSDRQYDDRRYADRSNKYGKYPRADRKHDARYPAKRSGISANIYYHAPSTTTITRNVQIIPPQNGVGDVYYSQESYYLYPPQPISRPYYHRPYQPLLPVTIDPKATENRSKQWTDKGDFNP